MQTRLTAKLGQRLALTPQLTQSLKVLAMNAMELEAYLEECVESNPLLELTEREAPDAPALDASAVEPWQEQGDNRWERLYNQNAEAPDAEQFWRDEPSLGERLHDQIDRQPMSDIERDIAHAIIDNLDDDGYFRMSPADLATDIEGADAAMTLRVLESIVQELEPAGIGARDLTECLLLQLDVQQPEDALARRLLLHFPDHLQDDDDTLAQLAEAEPEEIARARARMRRLDPFPGHGLRGEANIYIRPEIIFRKNSEGEIEVDVPAAAARGLKLNEQWLDHEFTGPDKEFMAQALKEARWLLHALDQRGETLLKVALCLARRQRAFLEYGVLGLKPLTLQDVAEEVGLHESTISRVTHGKYADTPIGVIELKRFFSAGLPTRGGGAISVYRVQQRVRALIESEPAGRPISDQAIADRLQAEGIEIARRTVAKYREQLGLPPSSQRRRAAKARRSTTRR